jgi:hypothetical protein
VKASDIGSPKGVINEAEDYQQAYVKRKRYWPVEWIVS